MNTNVIGSHTEIYVSGGDNWITENKATCFPTFCQRRILRPGETSEDFKVVTTAEKDVMEKHRDSWVRPPQSFIDQWNARVAISVCIGTRNGYNENTGYFELNTLVDLTYEDAQTVMAHFRADFNQDEAYARSLARTNMPYSSQWSGSYVRFAQNASSMETAVIPHVQIASLAQAFYKCSKLHTCEIRSMTSVTSVESMFTGCSKLANLRMKGLAKSLSLADSPLITAESLHYLCQNRGETSAITVTVHPDVYAKLTDETNTDWHQVLLDAAEKQITFITTE